MPTKGSKAAAAYDCYVREIILPKEGEKQIKYKLGFSLEVPEGYVVKLYPRSSVYKTALRLSNCVGIGDPDYRGEYMAIFDIIGYGKYYAKGERCCQLRIEKDIDYTFQEVKELSSTERGNNGFGSTGLN